MDVEIRAFDEGDLEDIVELHRQPQCIAQTLNLPYRSPEEIRARWRTAVAGIHRLVAAVEQDDKARIVGALWLNQFAGRRSHTAAIGMFVHDGYHRNGIGTRLMEAAIDLAERWLGVTRLELSVFCDNEAALRLYKRCGFEIEGTHRRYALRHGEYADVYAMARLR